MTVADPKGRSPLVFNPPNDKCSLLEMLRAAAFLTATMTCLSPMAAVSAPPSGCISAKLPERAVVGRDYQIAITDKSDRSGFDIAIISTSRLALCLDPVSWPNSQGKLDAGSEVFVATSTASWRLTSDFDFGVVICPKGQCASYGVPPYGRISGWLRMDQFPPEAAKMPHKLDFKPHLYFCGAHQTWSTPP